MLREHGNVGKVEGLDTSLEPDADPNLLCHVNIEEHCMSKPEYVTHRNHIRIARTGKELVGAF